LRDEQKAPNVSLSFWIIFGGVNVKIIEKCAHNWQYDPINRMCICRYCGKIQADEE